MTDPDVAREEQIARDYLAQLLKPRVIAGIDPDQLADHYIAWLRTHRKWKVTLWPPATSVRPTDPAQAAERTHRGAELARQALAAATHREDHH